QVRPPSLSQGFVDFHPVTLLEVVDLLHVVKPMEVRGAAVQLSDRPCASVERDGQGREDDDDDDNCEKGWPSGVVELHGRVTTCWGRSQSPTSSCTSRAYGRTAT